MGLRSRNSTAPGGCSFEQRVPPPHCFPHESALDHAVDFVLRGMSASYNGMPDVSVNVGRIPRLAGCGRIALSATAHDTGVLLAFRQTAKQEFPTCAVK